MSPTPVIAEVTEIESPLADIFARKGHCPVPPLQCNKNCGGQTSLIIRKTFPLNTPTFENLTVTDLMTFIRIYGLWSQSPMRRFSFC